MQDIVGKANFEEVNLQLSCNVKSGDTEKIVNKFDSRQVLCLQEVSWKYGVSNSQDNYGWPKSPLKISVSGLFTDRIETPFKISPPKLLIDQIEIAASNPSSLDVKLYFNLKGILVTPYENESLSLKEILGYILLDNNQKGLLALSESKQNIDETILTSFLFGKLPLDKLSSQQKSIEFLADSESLISLMIGDLVTFKSESPMNIEVIQELAKYLINKKWIR